VGPHPARRIEQVGTDLALLEGRHVEVAAAVDAEDMYS
jgi:hypothetical protein